MTTGMAVDAAPPQPMLLVDPGVLFIGGVPVPLVWGRKRSGQMSPGASPLASQSPKRQAQWGGVQNSPCAPRTAHLAGRARATGLGYTARRHRSYGGSRSPSTTHWRGFSRAADVLATFSRPAKIAGRSSLGVGSETSPADGPARDPNGIGGECLAPANWWAVTLVIPTEAIFPRQVALTW